MCLCEKKEQPYLTLRGLCTDSNIDRYWVTSNFKAELLYFGIQNTEIWYDYSHKHWQMRTTGKPELTAGVSDSSFHSFLLGKSSWYIEKDNDGEKKLIFLSILVVKATLELGHGQSVSYYKSFCHENII